MNNLVDKVYVINIKSAIDRMKSISEYTINAKSLEDEVVTSYSIKTEVELIEA